MAAGDFTWFSQAKVDLGNKLHNLGSGGDTLKAGFVNSTLTPTETDGGPNFGGVGATNYAANQVSGGDVPAGGVTLANQVFVVSGANAKFDFDDISVLQNAGNPSTARWLIVYNSTDANKRGLGFIDLGGVKDLTSGSFTYTVNASGIMTLS